MSISVKYDRNKVFKKRVKIASLLSVLIISAYSINRYINTEEEIIAYQYMEDNFIRTYNAIKEENDSYKSLISPNRKLVSIPTNLNKFHMDNIDYIESAMLLVKYIPLNQNEIEMILEYCNEKNVNPAVVFSLIKVESGFNTLSKNRFSSAAGLFQIIRSTGKFTYKRAFGSDDYNHSIHPYNTETSIPMFFAYMEYLLENYKGIRQSLEMYYGHSSKRERQKYAEKVIQGAYQYTKYLPLVVELDPTEDQKFNLNNETILLSKRRNVHGME